MGTYLCLFVCKVLWRHGKNVLSFTSSWPLIYQMKVNISHNMAKSEILDLTITISEIIPLQHHTKLAHEQTENLDWV